MCKYRLIERAPRSPIGVALALAIVIAGCSPQDGTGPGTSRVVWHVPAQGWNVRPSVDATNVYFASEDHRVYAIEKATGRILWQASTGVQSPYTNGFNTVVAGDVVAIGDVDVHAFERSTGAHRWTFIPPELDQPGHGTLTAYEGTIYAVSEVPRAYAIDAADGTVRWATDLPSRFSSGVRAFNPEIHEGVLFVGTKHMDNPVLGSIVALDAATGVVLWSHDFESGHENGIAGYLGLAVFHGPNVIAGVEDGRIHALDRVTGALRWTAPGVHPLPPEPGGAYGDFRRVVVAGDVVVAGSTSGITVGLDAITGQELWRFSEPRIGILYHSMSSDGKSVFMNSVGGKLYKLNAATGEVEWIMGTGISDAPVDGERTYRSAPVSDGDMLYVGGGAGFWALRK